MADAKQAVFKAEQERNEHLDLHIKALAQALSGADNPEEREHILRQIAYYEAQKSG